MKAKQQLKNNESHVVVGMSGGVDSSVAAYLLLEQGYRVSGLFMKNWEEDDTEEYCAAAEDLKDASQVCDRLGIELNEVNFAHEYWENVFSHFLEEYRSGRTPNPDVLCNKEIKFKEFLFQSQALGADYIATGHYVGKGSENGEHTLLKGRDENKDQSYFLYTLQQSALAKSLFPLGDIKKNQVREIAQTLKLGVHNKKDSTGICFIGERRFKDFLSNYVPPNPGLIVDLDGKAVGNHDGLAYYTLGQRQGLDIGGPGEAWYVAAKQMSSNELVVVQGHDHAALMSQRTLVKDLHWVSEIAPSIGAVLRAKTRYRQTDQACRIVELDADKLCVEFSEPQRAVTPGQALVLYDGNRCLGGGTIVSTSQSETSGQRDTVHA